MSQGEIKIQRKKNQDEMRFLSVVFELLESSRRQDQPEPGPCGQTSTSWRTTLDCFIIPKQILLTVKHFPQAFVYTSVRTCLTTTAQHV